MSITPQEKSARMPDYLIPSLRLVWPEPGGMEAVIPRLQRMECGVQAAAWDAVPPGASLGPRYRARPFDYQAELAHTVAESPCAVETLDAEVARFFRGAIRPGSDHALFNMVPQPDPDVTAAAMMSLVHNTNCLMDAFGGEGLLVEQQVARVIGCWVQWPQAMGISCSGGKMTLFYAIRNAIGQRWPEMRRQGVDRDVQVLCSMGAHYCVEHVASLAGIGADNCIRVAADASGGMCPLALRAALQHAHESGKRVAAIICCGGTTVGFACDDTCAVLAAVDSHLAANPGAVRPLLHLDSVIGWLYFTCMAPVPFEPSGPASLARAGARNRVARVVERLAGIASFDSLGVDFHKNGLAPYASSFFVARDTAFMDALGQGDHAYGAADFRFGQFRAYRYTVENSRAGNGILAAWISLKKFGRHGLADYLWTLQAARDELEKAMLRQGSFRQLNAASCGWELVFAIDFPDDLMARGNSPGTVAMAFMQACWDRTQRGEDFPLFSIVPGFLAPGQQAVHHNAFLIYPMRPLGVENWMRILDRIAAQRDAFVREVRAGQLCCQAGGGNEKPIR